MRTRPNTPCATPDASRHKATRSAPTPWLGRRALILAGAFTILPVNVIAAVNPSICRWGELPAPPYKAETLPLTSYSLAIHYAVPTNVPYDPAVLARIKRATRDILAWYQCASGGRTWVLEYPETVRVYSAAHTREYYLNNGNWWGSLPDEMGLAGYPIWTPGKVAAIWAHGAGWWAGAAQSCGVDCGVALLGVELFPEFNNAAYSGGACPGGVGVGAWPCTPEGAYAHELGHTVGLPHPADVPATSAVASHSIMQTHWDYPTYAPPADSPWGFLTLERQTLHANPFMAGGVSLTQTHDCALVDLPSSGAAPTASFTVSGAGTPLTVSFTDGSSGATERYWTFGDGSESGLVNPTHTYAEADTYTAKLRTYAANGMMAATSGPSVLVDVPTPDRAAGRFGLSMVGPSPFREFTSIRLEMLRAGLVEVSVLDIAGRRVATLAHGYHTAGATTLVWSGRNERGEPAPAGVYVFRARSSLERSTLRVMKIR